MKKQQNNNAPVARPQSNGLEFLGRSPSLGGDGTKLKRIGTDTREAYAKDRALVAVRVENSLHRKEFAKSDGFQLGKWATRFVGRGERRETAKLELAASHNARKSVFVLSKHPVRSGVSAHRIRGAKIATGWGLAALSVLTYTGHAPDNLPIIGSTVTGLESYFNPAQKSEKGPDSSKTIELAAGKIACSNQMVDVTITKADASGARSPAFNALDRAAHFTFPANMSKGLQTSIWNDITSINGDGVIKPTVGSQFVAPTDCAPTA